MPSEFVGLTEIASQLKKISKDTAVKDYHKLREIDISKIKHTSLVGNKAMDYFFFPHRLRTMSKRGISFIQWVTLERKEYETRLVNKMIDKGKTERCALYDTFCLYYGTINAFKPIIARSLYQHYKPTTILDFSMGWGGRCLGAMSLDMNYIGFDTNTTLTEVYDQMKILYPTKAKIEIIFEDSSKVDYSKYNYDMVFTSPPYYKKNRPIEKYEMMPYYKNRTDFNERFFFPVVHNTYKHLQNGGVYCLNIPMDMYDDVKVVIGEADEKIPLIIVKRTVGSNYKEYIYVWKKTSNDTPLE